MSEEKYAPQREVQWCPFVDPIFALFYFDFLFDASQSAAAKSASIWKKASLTQYLTIIGSVIDLCKPFVNCYPSVTSLDAYVWADIDPCMMCPAE